MGSSLMCTACSFDTPCHMLFAIESPRLWECPMEQMCACLIQAGHLAKTHSVALLCSYQRCHSQSSWEGTVGGLWQPMGVERRLLSWRMDDSSWETEGIRNSSSLAILVQFHSKGFRNRSGFNSVKCVQSHFAKMEGGSLMNCHPKCSISRLRKLVVFFKVHILLASFLKRG